MNRAGDDAERSDVGAPPAAQRRGEEERRS
jgi:hypothetical protein